MNILNIKNSSPNFESKPFLPQKYAAKISYLGTRYCGWQRQPEGRSGGRVSIQECFEKALQKMASLEKCRVQASGRTDAGVHALGQVVHFELPWARWEESVLMKGLNALLPCDIRILAIQAVSSSFHSQRSALSKVYSFSILQGPAEAPFVADRMWWIRKRLDVGAMGNALTSLIGEHNFLPFQASGAPVHRTTVRTILAAELVVLPLSPLPSADFHVLKINVHGTGFLKQMVRGIVGTLVQIGEGYRDESWIEHILCTQNRKLVGPTAQARGLVLERVFYPKELIAFD